jgi:hypothetical protein
MATAQTFVAPQRLKSVHHKMGHEWYQALELLNQHFAYASGKSAREFAELREARTLLNQMKYPDATHPVREDELAWAMKRIRDTFPQESHMFEKAAELLQIDLSQGHPLPQDLGRRIGNEIALMSRFSQPQQVAQAV